MLTALAVFVYLLLGVAFLIWAASETDAGPPPNFACAVFVIVTWPAFVLVIVLRNIAP